MNGPSSQSVAINRTLVGLIAATMLGSAAFLWYFLGSQNIWTGACLKVGSVMGALWLALPTISRHGNWGEASWPAVIGTLSVVLVLTSRRVDFRIILPLLIGVWIAVTILKPKSNPRR